ncbi:MAG: hypothetical protein ACUVWP_07980 [bacterium]
MAFIRKKGEYYYLVQSIRKGNEVRQITLAYLGKKPKVDDDVIKKVKAKYPCIDIEIKDIKLEKRREKEEDWLEYD